MKTNIDLREAAKSNGVRLWQIAEAIGTRPNDFSVMLRHELAQDVKEKAFAAIDDIVRGREKK